MVRTDLAYRKDQYRRSLKDDEQVANHTRGWSSIKLQLKRTMFHNMMEYVLSDITGLDEIQHNQLRKHDFASLQDLVLKKFQLRNAAYYEERLKKDLDASGAKAISEILAGLSTTLQEFLTDQDRQPLREFIDNWTLNNQIVDTIWQKSWSLESNFERYAQNHLMMGVMTGMTTDETPVAESQPFSQLMQQNNALYDSEGVLKANAKKRKHTSLEIVNDQSRESNFTPAYLNISEKIADNYFRLGFVGMYVSNKKTEGFSDRNLHTVINLAEKNVEFDQQS